MLHGEKIRDRDVRHWHFLKSMCDMESPINTPTNVHDEKERRRPASPDDKMASVTSLSPPSVRLDMDNTNHRRNSYGLSCAHMEMLAPSQRNWWWQCIRRRAIFRSHFIHNHLHFQRIMHFYFKYKTCSYIVITYRAYRLVHTVFLRYIWCFMQHRSCSRLLLT